jgi:hypothetical protein
MGGKISWSAATLQETMRIDVIGNFLSNKSSGCFAPLFPFPTCQNQKANPRSKSYCRSTSQNQPKLTLGNLTK